MIGYFLFLTFWVLAILFSYIYASNKYLITNSIIGNTRRKLSFSLIIFFSMMFTGLNFAYTQMFPFEYLDGDRGNYLYDFDVGRKETLALDFYFKCMHIFTDNFHVVLYFTTFFSCCVMFIAYKISKDARPVALLYILVSAFIYSSFINQKQIFANVFFYLAIVNYFNNDTFKISKFLISIILVIIACMFHTSAYIGIPLLFLLLYIKSKNNWNFSLFIIVLFIVLVFLKPGLLYAADLCSSFLPSFTNKIHEYFDSGGNTTIYSSKINFLKGMPFYFITCYGLLHKRNLHNKIDNYNEYLTLSCVASGLYFSSLISYWFSRFSTMFIFPVAVFFGLIVKNDSNKERRFFLKCIVIGGEFLIQAREMIMIYFNYLS